MKRETIFHIDVHKCIRINTHKSDYEINPEKQQMTPLPKKKHETLDHISEYNILNQKWKLDRAATVIHWELCKWVGFNNADKWNQQKSMTALDEEFPLLYALLFRTNSMSIFVDIPTTFQSLFSPDFFFKSFYLIIF